tara:strand:+ start:286 stop:687 length:402 start_codon:yes stop_codon:yes gene_type:complete
MVSRTDTPPADQLTLFAKTPQEQFEAWLLLPGATTVMADIEALAGGYVDDWKTTGIPVSMKLIVEQERHKIKLGKARAQALGSSLSGWRGYTINNSLTGPMARHLEARRPDWAGLFEKRQSPRAKSARLKGAL